MGQLIAQAFRDFWAMVRRLFWTKLTTGTGSVLEDDDYESQQDTLREWTAPEIPDNPEDRWRDARSRSDDRND